MTTLTPPRSSGTVHRILGSALVDLLVGPHGIDRYLELVRPDLTISEPRAEVVGVRRQTSRSVTLTLRPNQAFDGFQAGQFIRLGVEVGGIRRTRTYSPASSQHDARGLLELTATLRQGGLVSRHLREGIRPGAILHLSAPAGEFVLPERRPERIVLIGGGSGITPVMSMLRTLCDEGHRGSISFLHYARTRADFLYRDTVAELAERHGNIRSSYIATREGGSRLDAATLAAASAEDALIAVCGPPALIEAAKVSAPGTATVIAETFTPPTVAVTGARADGTIRFTASGTQTAITGGTLLEQAEAAGLAPEFGCRMGICHTCTCRKTAGAVQNILTGEISHEEDEDIQLCISVPAGDVALAL